MMKEILTMRILRFAPIYIILIAMFMTTGCGGKVESADTLPDTMPEMVDTVPLDTVKRDDGTPYIRMRTAEDAYRFIERSGHAAEYKRGIICPMIAENLEYAEKLLNNSHPRFIVVDKGSMRVILYNKYGVEEENFGMACSRRFGTKHKKADNRTPEGFFSVEGIYNSTDWLFTDDNGVTHPGKGVFGPRFIRLRIPNTSQIGIHGTSSPGSIGGRRSHGCIRITNDNILHLVKLVEKDMPVIVSPGPADRKVNEDEGYYVYSVKTGYEEKEFKAPEKKKSNNVGSQKSTVAAQDSIQSSGAAASGPSAGSVETEPSVPETKPSVESPKETASPATGSEASGQTE